MSIFAAIVALCVVIIIHEAGHYLAAVWTGMKVDRFSVFGIGPTILKLGTWRGTEFVISAIPFGAFVLIRGMEPNDEGDDPRAEGDAIDDDAWAKALGARQGDHYEGPPENAIGAAKGASVAPKAVSPNFRDKPLWARAAVLAGGPLANYVTAMLLFFVVFVAAGVPGPADRIEITKLSEGQPAAVAGLAVGDRIVQVGDMVIDPATGTQAVVDATTPHRGKTVEVTVLRDGQPLVLKVQPNADEGQPALGAMLAQGADRRAVGMGEAALLAVEEPIRITGVQLVGLYRWATGQLQAEMQGPARIVKHIATSIESGLLSFLKTAALISTLLGMFNLLPLPALDGGRLAFLGYEALSRRRASARVEELVHGYGMLALLVLIALVTVGDIRSFF
jgi:regulator of sigma E protease